MGIPLRVLIVEDAAADAELTLQELEGGGYKVEWQRVDGADAMRDALGERAWDLIVSDYSMPGFGGAAALDLLKKSRKDIPFIIVSGTAGETTAVEMMKAGAHDFFVKGRLKLLPAAVARELRDADVRRKQRESTAALLEIQARFDAFMNNIPTPAWIKDDRFRFVYMNASGLALFKRSLAEMMGRTDFDILPPAEVESLRKNDTRVLQSGRAINTMETITDAEGAVRVFTVLKFPLKDPAGRHHVAGIALDITERIHYREELDTANRRLEELLAGKVPSNHGNAGARKDNARH